MRIRVDTLDLFLQYTSPIPNLIRPAKMKRRIQRPTLDPTFNGQLTIILRNNIPEFNVNTTLSWRTSHHSNINRIIKNPPCDLSEYNPFVSMAVRDMDFSVGAWW